MLKPPLAQALLSSCESRRIPLSYPPDVLDEELPRTNRFFIAHYGITSSECNGLSRSVGSTGMTRIIHERFCCNRQCLTQAGRASGDTSRGIRDVPNPESRISSRAFLARPAFRACRAPLRHFATYRHHVVCPLATRPSRYVSSKPETSNTLSDHRRACRDISSRRSTSSQIDAQLYCQRASCTCSSTS